MREMRSVLDEHDMLFTKSNVTGYERSVFLNALMNRKPHGVYLLVWRNAPCESSCMSCVTLSTLTVYEVLDPDSNKTTVEVSAWHGGWGGGR